MRESEVYRILEKHSKEITQAVGLNFRLFAQAILDIAIYREAWDEIIYHRHKFIWLTILNIFSPKSAKKYFSEVYNDKKLRRLQEEADTLKKKVKEASCSGQKNNPETNKGDSQDQEIIVPSKTIVDANNRPLSSK